jgi:hypothetical protein
MTCMSCMTLSVTHVDLIFLWCVEPKVMQPIQVMQGTEVASRLVFGLLIVADG